MNVNASKYLEKRLNEWAEWSLHDSTALGYPRKNILAAFRENGGVIIKSRRTQTVPDNATAEEMERFIVELAQQNKQIAKALKTYYLEPGTGKQKARRLGISYAYFRTRVSMARLWLCGRLSSAKFKEKIKEQN